MTNIMILTSLAEQSSSSDVGRREFLGPVTDIFLPQSKAWSTRVCSITNTWYLSSTQSVGYEAQSPVPDPISEWPLHDRGGPVKLRIVWLYSLSVCSSSFIWFRYLDWEFTWSLSVYSSLERLVCFIFSFHREERYISTDLLNVSPVMEHNACHHFVVIVLTLLLNLWVLVSRHKFFLRISP